ncbi:hypothetical protein FPOA_14046 [Fusarium poae]|uniref:Heterokaryon incompatibility domain-containing protein n=1 Tax=Fusarium poae TaxID=36050 RepID=A0A1B8A3H7_FUSPO|nr:hypothetical protein FPOA_14046 [Fusarium poae]
MPTGWKYDFDNGFAEDLVTRSSENRRTLSSSDPPVRCCPVCSPILFPDGDRSCSDLAAADGSCRVCRFILSVVQQHHNDDGQRLSVRRTGSALITQPKDRRVLYLCSDIGPSEVVNNDIQISFPVLPAGDDPWCFSLLRAWVERCDTSHKCHRGKGELPTRLLKIGDNGAPANLWLVSGQTLNKAKYIALSHCWGKTVPGETPSYCTTKNNISARENGFSTDDLPATFQDAIEVTRQLGLQYLWIDSLCIIQGEGGDWEQEAGRMQNVYASAYCTLAATSARDSNSGFLKRTVNSQYICVQDNLGRQIYVCSDPADFDTDVERAELNSRAWVVQERFLSCRTIHFGAHQMYWECGKEVYCEDMTRLTAPSLGEKYFKLDPKFPGRLRDSGITSTINFIQSLFEDYSKCELTIATDRAVALSGLTGSIAATLGSRMAYGYGAFDLFLHRSLLWMRIDLDKKKIEYGAGRKVPSWSWMAYEGGIQFISLKDLPFRQLYVFKDITFLPCRAGYMERTVLRTKVWKFLRSDLRLEASAEGKYRILVSPGEEIGWIMPDGEIFEMELAVVVGRVGSSRSRDREYYILVVKERETNVYERVGIGKIHEGYMSKQDGDVHLV